jgi:hypothetical protein
MAERWPAPGWPMKSQFFLPMAEGDLGEPDRGPRHRLPRHLGDPTREGRVVDPLPPGEVRHRQPAPAIRLHQLPTPGAGRHPPPPRIALLARVHHLRRDRTHPGHNSRPEAAWLRGARPDACDEPDLLYGFLLLHEIAHHVLAHGGREGAWRDVEDEADRWAYAELCRGGGRPFERPIATPIENR